MTTARLPAAVLARAGLPVAEVADWSASAPGPQDSFPAAAEAVSIFLGRGQALTRRLPAPGACAVAASISCCRTRDDLPVQGHV